MIHHCIEHLPFEACGLLSGKEGKIDTLWKMDNVERSATAFSMDEKQIRCIFRMMEKREETLTGIYHSHPTGIPYPSVNDIVNHHYPKAAYFIISLAYEKPLVKCYSIQNGKVTPLTVQVIKSAI
ncbi:proteasome lid subunit RPN8/RPN11 [Bacillus fengqiuensis]|nr:proteasome lid subunit RPN8/RPN11 [Bacillus fengqiuensis]